MEVVCNSPSHVCFVRGRLGPLRRVLLATDGETGRVHLRPVSCFPAYCSPRFALLSEPRCRRARCGEPKRAEQGCGEEIRLSRAGASQRVESAVRLTKQLMTPDFNARRGGAQSPRVGRSGSSLRCRFPSWRCNPSHLTCRQTRRLQGT